MTQGTAVRLRHCAKTFAGGRQVLQPLDLDIHPGETLVFLGPSGCGKTTTLRLIAGLEQPDAGGQVLFDDRDVTGLPIERRDVGMVFQNYALFPNLDVAGNIAYGLKIRGLPRAERDARVAELLAMMHLEPLAERRIQQLSGGQRQRVALARALAPRPRVLLFDEPLAALDAQLREQLRADIGALLRELGTTAVYVTHDQQEALALGDRIVVMGEGRIAQIGTPTQIYQRPASRFVAGFVGQLNRFEVRAHSGAEVAVAGGRLPWTGAASTLFCRPEHLEPSATPAHLTGILVGQFFQGAHSRLLVEVGTGQPLLVDTAQPLQAQPGDLLHLNVRPDALFTLAS
ncbi:ABC transporter ATP-binding protein [Pseudomonas sp. HR1]|jgi:putative spermidine/putrescine transport system ATP-binding protein|uniref:Spermidine/putrescine transport system ATP-binding protein n=7 Tax=Gammaproteobacteria TaxID=1236 RepID=A0A1G5M713_9PSED|nr:MULTISPECIES: ABC transporter ATP-binding protein [Pseudomonas]MDK4199194.1 ABC transporter ATP-binding protein [Pseudomonas sp. HR1]NMY88729.1 ABC transporter ATP-binding protein [Pseudomonas psychrotolerans]RED06767.1 putative spermidine/putrescine transport system ATP-binding protein [Pseudomonas oleovorans]SCZ20531.1 putative spermidine/putrescine transport system ATP-binding protein [Pseudomonas psychrotolerans]